MTNDDVVRDAMGLIGILRISQSPDANQAAQALRTMNDMFFEWEGKGIHLGYSSQSGSTDTFPLDETLLQTVKANLAVRLCPYYERQASPILVAIATEGYNRLMRDAAAAAREESSTANLPISESRIGRFYSITGQ